MRISDSNCWKSISNRIIPIPAGWLGGAESYKLDAETVDVSGQGGSVPDILSPFQSYDQHHHNLNYYMYLQSQSSGHAPHHPLSSHYNNSLQNNI